MSNQRRGFFRDAFAGLRKLVEDAAPELDAGLGADLEPTPTFVPPVHAPARAVGPLAAAKVVRRPPGAVPEAQFLALCTGCGACVEACPETTLTSKDRYPEAHPEVHACIMCKDVPCAAACETGALLPIAPTAIRFGTVRALPRLCLNHGPRDEDSEPCDRCADWCRAPGALRFDERHLPVIDATQCTGCGLCAEHCAAYPKALAI